MSQLFIKNIEVLDFYEATDSDRSLLLTVQLDDPNLSQNEIFELETALDFKADAVYFRHFLDTRSAIPQIYLYDNTDGLISNEDLAEIHRDLWSSCRIPMFIVMNNMDFAVYDARKPIITLPNGQITTEPITGKINLISDTVALYSKARFDSGIFWESDEAKGNFRESTSAYKDLIDNLKTVRKKFLESKILPEQTANKLLVYSILIKYLEERGNEGDRLFAKGWFQQQFGADNLCEVLRKGKAIDLFDQLSRQFNGKIFEWSDPKERKLLENVALTQLASFLDGDTNLETGQGVFDWAKYSFNRLPVELISSVYEEFLNERKDAVYTPEFLVNTLVEQSMPEHEYGRTSVKTIDVSCGSGIFLVSVFKRLVQRHRYASFKKTGTLSTLKSKELLKIIKENIFGVDIEKDAVQLAIFSVCLALCDELTPKEIWTDLKFDDSFHRNFKAENFFDYLRANEDQLETFDLLIGNVPFAELNVEKDKESLFYYLDKDKNAVNLNTEISNKLSAKSNVFPRNQLALMFLDQSPQLLKSEGLLCLIVPAAPLLYNNSGEFRRNFFSKYKVQQIIDFTNLDSILFETADVPTAAIFVRRELPNEIEPISHITIHRTKSVEEKIFFEIDKYDFHYVEQIESINEKHLWKCNLLGGGRLNDLVKRLAKYKSVSDMVRDRKWTANEGYIIGSPKNKKRKKAPFITDRPSVQTRSFKNNREIKIVTELEKLFHSTGDEKIYHPPHLLLKETIDIPSYFSDEYLTFKHRIIGINAPKSERQELLKLYNAFRNNQDTYKIFIAATSNEYLVGRATSILKQDIMNLPYTGTSKKIELSFVEQIICDDVLNYGIDMLSMGSKADANWQKATRTEIEKFSKVFTKMLNSVYGRSGKNFYFTKLYRWGDFCITEFEYGANQTPLEEEKINEPTDGIKSLIHSKYGKSAHLIKVLKLYERNKVYLIKPNTLRYWLQSIAIKDADEAFSDSIIAGY